MRAAISILCFALLLGFAGSSPTRLAAQVTLPELDTQHGVKISADKGARWREGKYEVLWLDGPCEITQGPRVIRGTSAMIWIDHADDFSLSAHKVIAYIDGAEITHHTANHRPAAVLKSPQWLGNLQSNQPIFYAFKQISSARPDPLPPIYAAAMKARVPDVQPLLSSFQTGGVQPAQFAGPFTGPPTSDPTGNVILPNTPIQPGQIGQLQPGQAGINTIPGALSQALAGSTAAPFTGGLTPRRIRVFPRSNVQTHMDSFITPNGRERVTIIDSGVNILIEGAGPLGKVDISTDRAVIWQPADEGELDLEQGMDPDGAPNANKALEFYLEGNIVFRQGDRVIYATSMYYNVREEIGTILDAELLAGVPNFPGTVRLKADVLRQIDSTRFQAHQAALTTSRMGIPRYWFQAGDVAFEDRQQPIFDPVTGAPMIDPITGKQAVDHQRLATSRNNVVYIGEVPVFYWPFLGTDLTKPTTFVNRVRVKNDQVFGTQIGLGFDLKQLLGITGNPGTDWSANVDWLSDRGVGFGTTYDYVLPDFFGIPGETRGFLDAWGIDDNGLDNLGLGRRALQPEEDFRGRVLWQHRQRTPSGWQITGELGLISDRNFLEQYNEREWDQWKDQDTGVEFKRLLDNQSFNISGDLQLNDFFTTTEWLPRLDHFFIGQSLLQDRATGFGHSHIGYGKLEPATTPIDPTDREKFNPLPWEADTEGIRAGGRYEIDVPFQLGPVKVVPFALGEAIHWGETLDGSDRTRLLGQAGIRASLPMWTADPNCQNVLFNVNGLAHKVVWEGEFLWADADQNIEDLPLYDQLDDNAVEHFRRRFVDDAFGGALNVNDTVPLKFDERNFAFRSGLQRWVSSPAAEIADDLMMVRGGVRQRWQTHRGLPGYQRTVDWMTLDMQGTWYPKANRDNFGQDFGMVTYDWRWHVGDRLTLMSDGYLDTFGDGLRMFTVGGYISRPERGSAYLGFRSIEGPISSNVLNASFSYRMSEKWIASAGTVVDFGRTGNIGQVFEITRIGESFLISVGANLDASRNNLGFGFSVEPRFLRHSYRGRVGGVAIPPSGAYGLE